MYFLFDQYIIVVKEERRKRKQEEDTGGPRIKLKISVNRSPDKTDTSYKVVKIHQSFFF